MISDQFTLDLNRELIVDNFAGGGGTSCGIEIGLGRYVDIAINHDPRAIAMHTANHPQTHHIPEDVFAVDPLTVTGGRPVGFAWFSPDCKHFSKAKGGKPRSKKIRGLAWVMVKWGAIVRPRVMVLENVEEFKTWGPVLGDGSPCPRRKGRTFQNFVARLRNLGYVVEWRELRACDYGLPLTPFMRATLGVKDKVWSAPTTRKRLFLIARCDGRPIVWPEPLRCNPKKPVPGLLPWRTAAECIDFSLPCPSIFLTKEEARKLRVKRPLAEPTHRRIYRGLRKFCIDNPEPFIVPLTHQGSDRVESLHEPMRTITGANRGERALVTPFLTECANGSQQRVFAADEPLRTQCAEVKGGHFAIVSPTLIQTGYGEREGQAPRVPGLDQPLGTVVAGGSKHALVSAFLAKHFSGEQLHASALDAPIHTVTATDHNALVTANLMVNNTGHTGGAADAPMPTIPTGGHHALVAANLTKYYGERRPDEQRPGAPLDEPLHTQSTENRFGLVTSHLAKLYGTSTGQPTDEPLPTVTSGGNHIAEVRAFLIKYYGNEKEGTNLRDPMHTVTTKDRLGLVTVHGQDYVITDIGMRMLKPRELYRGQGFLDSYIIDPLVPDKRGRLKPLTEEQQVQKCGNSVPPPMAAAIAYANVPELSLWAERAA